MKYYHLIDKKGVVSTMSAKPNVEVTQEVVKIKGFDLGSCFDSKEVADIWSDLHNGVINQEQLKYKLNGMLSVTN